MLAADLPAPRRFLVIRNPAAGRRHPRRLEAVLERLRRGGCAATVAETAARGDAVRLAREADAGRYDVVVAAGGDGTISEVVNGLMGRPADDLALGIIALGTANVLAREIGVGTGAQSLAAALLDGAPTPLAVAHRIGDDGSAAYFLLMLGVGFDAHVVAGVSDVMKRRLGKGAYVWRSLVEMLRYRDRRYRVEVDDAVHEAASVIVSRGRFYGGAFVVAPAADLRQAALSVCLFERGGRWQVLRYGAALMTGRLPGAAGYRVIDADRVRIASLDGGAGDRPEPVQVDGDNAAALPLSVTLAPRRLRLLMPST
jgi:YegS/Rv2252/BmrU family lipid kinase